MTSINAKDRSASGAPNAIAEAHFRQRSPRRQYLAKRLHAAGPRPLLEALIEVSGGHDLDCVLERYARIPAEIYQALGAHALSVDSVRVIDGGRA